MKLGDLFFDVKLNTAKLQTDLIALNSQVKASTDGMKKNFNSLSQSLRGTGLAITAIGVGMAFALGKAVSASAQFESGLANIATNINGNSAPAIARMRKELLDLSDRMPLALSDLTSGLYDVTSAGISGAKALGVLNASGKLATAGLGSAAEGVDIMTTAVNTFADEGQSAADQANAIFTGIQKGKMTISQMSQAFGQNAAIVHNYGVSLAEYIAVTASLTDVGIPAAQAQDDLRAAVVSLIRPTKQMNQILKELGVRNGQELINNSKNLGEAFKKVYDASDKLGIALPKATGRIEGAVAITSIATNANKLYADTLDTISNNAGALEGAFKKQTETFKSQLTMLGNKFERIGIIIGDSLVPILKVLGKTLDIIVSVFLALPGPIQTIISLFAGLTTVLALVVGPLLILAGSIGSIIAAGIALTGSMAALGAALAGFGAVLAGLALPATAVVVAIGLIIAAGSLLITH